MTAQKKIFRAISAALAFALLATNGQSHLAQAWLPKQGTVPPVTNISSADSASASTLSSEFIYQGELKKSNNPVSGTCDFQFGLWDAASAGSQIGATKSVTSVNVSAGRFASPVDFGNQFTGDGRWIQVGVKCASDIGFTTLPRQLIYAAPYAMGLKPNVTIRGSVPGATGDVLHIINTATTNYGNGIRAEANTGSGIIGTSQNWFGVWGESYGNADGVAGTSSHPERAGVAGRNDKGGFGVWGISPNVGVGGVSDKGIGVKGTSQTWAGVAGFSGDGRGVWGSSTNSDGGYFRSENGHGVLIESNSPRESADGAALRIVHTNPNTGIAIWASGGPDATLVLDNAKGGPLIKGFGANGGEEEFNVQNDGSILGKQLTITGGSDLAEKFDTADGKPLEPGTLLVIDESHPGMLRPSNSAYDSKVAGIVSGAGGVNPGLTLHQTGAMDGSTTVAIAGRVYLKAEANSATIKPGDLLTTSDIPGTAMKATDGERSHGAIIGKAMTSLETGNGLVLVLVNLQ